jgi:hypothetical protein
VYDVNDVTDDTSVRNAPATMGRAAVLLAARSAATLTGVLRCGVDIPERIGEPVAERAIGEPARGSRLSAH